MQTMLGNEQHAFGPTGLQQLVANKHGDMLCFHAIASIAREHELHMSWLSPEGMRAPVRNPSLVLPTSDEDQPTQL